MSTLTYTLLKLIPFGLIVLLIIKLYGLFKKRRELQRALKDFPGPAPHWLWGNMEEVS
jgi:hypothetical protein